MSLLRCLFFSLLCLRVEAFDGEEEFQHCNMLLKAYGVSAIAPGARDRKADREELKALRIKTGKACKRAAQTGHPYAQNQFAFMLHTGGIVRKNSAQALLWWKKSAKQNNPMALTNIAHFYFNPEMNEHTGLDLKQSFRKGVQLYKQAASGRGKESADAQRTLGILYATGRGLGGPHSKGLSVDFSKAVTFFRLAAVSHENTSPLVLQDAMAVEARSYSLNQLGLAYYTGRGVIKNFQLAAYWYKRAADEGQAEGQANLANMYEHGRGVQMNITEATRLYKLAAAENNEHAPLRLGLMYHTGLLKDDASRSRKKKWFKQAAKFYGYSGKMGEMAMDLWLTAELKKEARMREDDHEEDEANKLSVSDLSTAFIDVEGELDASGALAKEFKINPTTLPELSKLVQDVFVELHERDEYDMDEV